MNRIDGCKHTGQRMAEWAAYGACPICLTAATGQLREQRDELMAVVRAALVSLSQSATFDVPPIVLRDVCERLQAVNQKLNLV